MTEWARSDAASLSRVPPSACRRSWCPHPLPPSPPGHNHMAWSYTSLPGPLMAAKRWFIFAQRLISGCLLAVKYSLISFNGRRGLDVRTVSRSSRSNTLCRGLNVDDEMACIDVARLYQRCRTAMKNCLIKLKRKSVILFHSDANAESATLWIHWTHDKRSYLANKPSRTFKILFCFNC